MECNFVMPECCEVPRFDRAGAIDKLVIYIHNTSSSEYCSNVKFWKKNNLNSGVFFAHFSISLDGEITKYLPVEYRTHGIIPVSESIFIGIEADITNNALCSNGNYSQIYDSLFRILCCIHKELELTQPLPIVFADAYFAEHSDAYKPLKNTVTLAVNNLKTNCLNVELANGDQDGCVSLDYLIGDCGNCGDCNSCESQTSNRVEKLELRLLKAENDLKSSVASFDAFKQELNFKLLELSGLSGTVVAFQEFYGTHLACLRKLCVLNGCHDCKVHYSIFKENALFTGVNTPLTFDTRVTDNDPSYVTNNGYFRYCPSETGNYQVKIADLLVAPAKYCAGDTIEVYTSTGTLLYTHTVLSNVDNHVVQLPDINNVEPFTGGCLSISVLIKSKDYITRKIVSGNITIYKIS